LSGIKRSSRIAQRRDRWRGCWPASGWAQQSDAIWE